jgi:hypothetical protein
MKKTVRLRRSIQAMVIASILAAAFSLAAHAASPASAYTAKDFAGTWHWMFQGKPFATMVISLKGDQFSGSITNGTISMDQDGKITSAESVDGTSPIVRGSLQNGVLHVVVKHGDDESEWTMTLTSPETGELKTASEAAPANAESIHLEKAQ